MAQTANAYAIEPQTRPVITVMSNAPVFSDDLFARFIDYTDRKATTVKGYVSCIRQFAKWLQANGIEQPTRAHIKEYRDHLAASDLKAGTQSQYLRAVRHFFRWTASEGLYPNIADNVHGAKVDNKAHKRDEVPISALPGIAASIDRETEQGKRLYAMFMLCVCNGTRCVELHRANVGDLKTVNGHTWLYLQGKGHDEADQKQLLIDPVAEAVRDYLDARAEPVAPKSPLFTVTGNRCGRDASGKPSKRVSTNAISAALKTLLKANGYDSDRLTAHSLRHSMATASIEAGNDLHSTQKLMRHQDPATTEVYIHEADSDANEITGRAAIYNYIFNGIEATPILPELQAAIEAMSLDEQRQLLETITKGGK